MFGLQHPHVVKIYNFYRDDPKYYYMVLEFAAGGELIDRIAQKVSGCHALFLCFMRFSLFSVFPFFLVHVLHTLCKPYRKGIVNFLFALFRTCYICFLRVIRRLPCYSRCLISIFL